MKSDLEHHTHNGRHTRQDRLLRSYPEIGLLVVPCHYISSLRADLRGFSVQPDHHTHHTDNSSNIS